MEEMIQILICTQGISLSNILELVRLNPNDADLGQKLRKIIIDEQNRRNTEDRKEKNI